MIKPFIHDTFLLSQKCGKATQADASVADDMIDTLRANKQKCVGLAANMLGTPKRIIAFFDGDKITEMFNPEITDKKIEYEASEGCMSLSGVRKTKRYRLITVRYETRSGQIKAAKYEGFTAEIIQHEIDHCNGILI